MSDKEANLKEKLRQALTSTVRVISDDLEIKTNPEYNKSSKKFDFYENYTKKLLIYYDNRIMILIL